MDREYQRCLLRDNVARLQASRAADSTADLDGTGVFVRLFGPGGRGEPYLAKIEVSDYPVAPWRVSFIDPAADATDRWVVPDRDPRFWPYSPIPGLHGGFHVHYPGPYRVFVCLPFTREFFYYHPELAWHPEIYDLPRVICELELALKRAQHFSLWWDRLFARVG